MWMVRDRKRERERERGENKRPASAHLITFQPTQPGGWGLLWRQCLVHVWWCLSASSALYPGPNSNAHMCTGDLVLVVNILFLPASDFSPPYSHWILAWIQPSPNLNVYMQTIRSIHCCVESIHVLLHLLICSIHVRGSTVQAGIFYHLLSLSLSSMVDQKYLWRVRFFWSSVE